MADIADDFQITVLQEIPHPTWTERVEKWHAGKGTNSGPIDSNIDLEMRNGYALDGSYIGDIKVCKMLEKRGIIPERRDEDSKVASIGKDKNGKWWGWSHRAISHFPTRKQADIFAESVACLEVSALEMAGKVEETRYGRVYVNPTKDQMKALFAETGGPVRGIIDCIKKILYTWSAWDAVHRDMLNILGLSNKYKFTTTFNINDVKKAGYDYRNLDVWKQGLSYYKDVASLETAGKVEQTKYGKVYLNPTKDQMKTLLAEIDGESIRVIIYSKRNFYAWNAYKAIHNDMIKALGLDFFEVDSCGEFTPNYVKAADYDYHKLMKLWNEPEPLIAIGGKVERTVFCPVFINPTKQQMQSLIASIDNYIPNIRIRAIANYRDETFYAWHPMHATHHQIQELFYLDDFNAIQTYFFTSKHMQKYKYDYRNLPEWKTGLEFFNNFNKHKSSKDTAMERDWHKMTHSERHKLKMTDPEEYKHLKEAAEIPEYSAIKNRSIHRGRSTVTRKPKVKPSGDVYKQAQDLYDDKKAKNCIKPCKEKSSTNRKLTMNTTSLLRNLVEEAKTNDQRDSLLISKGNVKYRMEDLLNRRRNASLAGQHRTAQRLDKEIMLLRAAMGLPKKPPEEVIRTHTTSKDPVNGENLVIASETAGKRGNERHGGAGDRHRFKETKSLIYEVIWQYQKQEHIELVFDAKSFNDAKIKARAKIPSGAKIIKVVKKQNNAKINTLEEPEDELEKASINLHSPKLHNNMARSHELIAQNNPDFSVSSPHQNAAILHRNAASALLNEIPNADRLSNRAHAASKQLGMDAQSFVNTSNITNDAIWARKITTKNLAALSNLLYDRGYEYTVEKASVLVKHTWKGFNNSQPDTLKVTAIGRDWITAAYRNNCRIRAFEFTDTADDLERGIPIEMVSSSWNGRLNTRDKQHYAYSWTTLLSSMQRR